VLFFEGEERLPQWPTLSFGWINPVQTVWIEPVNGWIKPWIMKLLTPRFGSIVLFFVPKE